MKSRIRTEIIIALLAVITCQYSCSQNTNIPMQFEETQLTNVPYGHTLHNTQVFSKDDKWIVYDIRNEGSKIAQTGRIEMVNTETGEVKVLYATQNQTEYGPGVGAVTFSPVQDTVLFIHGIRNSDKKNPYSFTRRTGVAIDIHKPLEPIFMDARDVTFPFTPGALRGGTHAHTWSGDGKWISFTYNDFIIEQLAKKDSKIRDMRTVGIMVPRPVIVDDENQNQENNSGTMFSVIVARVTENPRWGSDEIDKAFDETWIGKDGYLRKNGQKQKRAIAFQGNVKNKEGKTITEVFVCDLPGDPTRAVPGRPLEGTATTLPNIPESVVQRRITRTKYGIEGPRHWLRSTSDGSLIVFLARDSSGIIQIFGVSPNEGSIKQITFNPFSVQGPFNISPDDKYIAYHADNSVFITDIFSGKTNSITRRFDDWERPVEAPVWSNNGKKIAYVRKVRYPEGDFLQVFLLNKK